MSKHSDALLKNNFKSGDRVKLISKCGDYADGWDNSWDKYHEPVGTVMIVDDPYPNDSGISCYKEGAKDETTNPYPAHCLEKLSKTESKTTNEPSLKTKFKVGDKVIVLKKSDDQSIVGIRIWISQ